MAICPICLGDQFIDVNQRAKVRCADCGSLERTRLIWLVLQELLPADDMLDTIHFAPEEGLARKLHERSGSRYRAFDFSPKLYPFAFLKVEQLDLCRGLHAFKRESVDLILHNHVLEHLPCNYACVMIALNALLRPGGFHVFSVPITANYYREDLDPGLDANTRLERFAQGDHLRSFGRRDLGALWFQLFQQDIHFSKLVAIDEESLLHAAIPLNALTQITSHTVFVWKKPVG